MKVRVSKGEAWWWVESVDHWWGFPTWREAFDYAMLVA